ncbi:MAG: dTMP kinase [Parcubacteria group bacterium Gr01-1014_20]|nr:MAG: dTMP kinase [Parcubacteria group bacterium Gr01-1014_20]
MEKKKGKFIVFEGPDGSGQSTQSQLLKNYLESKNYQVVLTKQPTKESEASKKISDILNHRITATPEEFQQLFVDDRKEHLEKLILPSLNEGKVVVSDRYFFSSLAFGSLNCDLEWLIGINKGFPIPDKTFILDVSPEVCVERIMSRGLPVQFFETKEKLGKVMENYRKAATRFPGVHLVSGERPIDVIHQEILSKLENILI